MRGDAPLPPAWADWWAGFREASLPDLPPDPTPDQLDAWLELAELLAQADFRNRIRQMATHAHDVPRPQSPIDLGRIFDAALRAEASGIAPQDPAADGLVAQFVEAHEPALGAGPDLHRRALEHIERYDDPRARLYWRLVARIRGVADRPWPQAQAFDWLVAALRARSDNLRQRAHLGTPTSQDSSTQG